MNLTTFRTIRLRIGQSPEYKNQNIKPAETKRKIIVTNKSLEKTNRNHAKELFTH